MKFSIGSTLWAVMLAAGLALALVPGTQAAAAAAAATTPGAAPAPAPAPSNGTTTVLPAFSSINVCVPFSVLVEPAADNKTYSVNLNTTSPSLQKAFSAEVANGVLSLTTTSDFSSSTPIRVRVFVPQTALRSVSVSSPLSTFVVIGQGFSSNAFTIANAGSSNVDVAGILAQTLDIQNNGAGAVIVEGTINSSTIANNGAGRVFIGGNLTTVNVQVSGVGEVFVDPISPTTQITGSAELLGTVRFTRGVCNIAGSTAGVTGNPAVGAVNSLLNSLGQASPFQSGPFGNPCQQASQVDFTIPPPTWTCGITVLGAFNCSTGTSAAVSSSGSTGAFTVGQGVATSPSGSVAAGQNAAATSGGGQALAAGGGSAPAVASGNQATSSNGGTVITSGNGVIAGNGTFLVGTTSCNVTNPSELAITS